MIDVISLRSFGLACAIATADGLNPLAPGSDTAAGILAIVVAAVLLLGVGLVIRRGRRRRILRIADQLRAQGFVVNTDVQKRPKLPFPEFTRHRGQVYFQITAPGTWDTALTYMYTERVGAHGETQTVKLSCALVPLPFSTASVSIWKGGRSLFGRLSRNRVETDSVRFNELYEVSSDDERFAYTMLSYEVVDWFLSEPPLAHSADIRIGANWMLVARPAIDELELPQLLYLAASLRDRFPAVLSSLYPLPAPPS